ncbi:MAG: kelch repeat-containing protein [Vicingaceae bacterium]
MIRSILIFSTVFCLSTVALGQWTKKASVPGPQRHHPVTFTIDGKAYYLTGMTSTNAVLKDFYEYDPANDSWTKKTDFPGTARGFAYGASIDGKGYIGMGLSSSAYLNDLWEYDPINDQWTQLATMNGPGRRHPAFIAFQGKIYVGLGDGQTGNLNDWYIYTIATDTWVKGPSLPAIARHHPYYFHTGSQVYAGMGHSSSGIERDWWKFDVVDNKWVQMNNFPGEARVAGTQFTYNNKGHILGGDGSDHQNLDTGEFYEYDEVNDTWKELPPAPGQGRWASGSFVIGDIAYMTSGETGNLTLYNDLWAYDMTIFNSVDEEEQRNASLSVYPNPANDFINLGSGLDLSEINTLTIYDPSGRAVSVPAVNRGQLDISNLSPQLYLLVATLKSGRVFQSRFIKE